ncbi:F-box domain containing protein [Trema orientale]|uniref:F-box domain containing protein n=1 Tax=Trema orientale TaxID=63057 RepID=A0A2P5EDF2_TREOI|nr:F-box domain containing protein [Trema orientale]
MTSFYHLPEGVLEVIFSWLPADSLVRFKCVNKSWYSLICALINDPSFVSKQLHNTRNKSSASLLLTRTCPHVGHNPARSYALLTSFIDDGDKDQIRSVTEDINFPLRWSEWLLRYHCDGIICLLKDKFGTEVVLCNPTLQEFKLLPKSKNARKLSCIGTGFGYDSRANCYKFVRILYHAKKVSAEVCTLGSDYWRGIKVSDDLVVDLAITFQDYIYWQGVCYWMMLDNSLGDIILCFDMSDEVFHMIRPPKVSDYSSFGVWNDSFALFLCSEERENPELISFEMWVMDDCLDVVKGACPLTKRLVFGPLLCCPVPLKFWKNDELLLVSGEDEKLLSYNLRTQKLRKIQADGEIYMPFCFYVKSLVSLRVGERSTRRRSKRRRIQLLQ